MFCLKAIKGLLGLFKAVELRHGRMPCHGYNAFIYCGQWVRQHQLLELYRGQLHQCVAAELQQRQPEQQQQGQ